MIYIIFYIHIYIKSYLIDIYITHYQRDNSERQQLFKENYTPFVAKVYFYLFIETEQWLLHLLCNLPKHVFHRNKVIILCLQIDFILQQVHLFVFECSNMMIIN